MMIIDLNTDEKNNQMHLKFSISIPSPKPIKFK